MAAEPFLSVVIPARNEEVSLPATLAHVRQIPEVLECCVVDGGSTDGTLACAEQAGARCLTALPNRGVQMRLGAEASAGSVVLFLHADTWLPPGAGRAILQVLEDPETAGGAFWKQLRDAPWCLRGSRFRSWLFFQLSGCFLGDQALFARASALKAAGGVPPIPLMEDLELCRALSRQGRLRLAPATVRASARRFRSGGVVRTYARMLRVLAGHALGQSPDQLRRIYEA